MKTCSRVPGPSQSPVQTSQNHVQGRCGLVNNLGDRTPVGKVLRLWQIENKLDIVIDTQLTKDIPLAR